MKKEKGHAVKRIAVLLMLVVIIASYIIQIIYGIGA